MEGVHALISLPWIASTWQLISAERDIGLLRDSYLDLIDLIDSFNIYYHISAAATPRSPKTSSLFFGRNPPKTKSPGLLSGLAGWRVALSPLSSSVAGLHLHRPPSPLPPELARYRAILDAIHLHSVLPPKSQILGRRYSTVSQPIHLSQHDWLSCSQPLLETKPLSFVRPGFRLFLHLPSLKGTEVSPSPLRGPRGMLVSFLSGNIDVGS